MSHSPEWPNPVDPMTLPGDARPDPRGHLDDTDPSPRLGFPQLIYPSERLFHGS